MAYLSRLIIDGRRHDVQRDLADCHRMHARLMTVFPAAASPANAREQFGVLFRPEPLADLPLLRVLVQSTARPDWSALPPGYLAAAPDGRGNPAVRLLDDEYRRVVAGMRLRFRLRANPTKRINDRSTYEKNPAMRGKRVELRDAADQIAWLERKGAAAGFRLVRVAITSAEEIPNVRVGNRPLQRGRQGVRRLTFGAVVFDGLLDVTDAASFTRTLEQGIGSGKAFGFGLLSIAAVAREVTL